MSKDKEKKSLHIIARPAKGFRRAGFEFSANKPTIINVGDISTTQYDQLVNEPNLVVVVLGDNQPEADLNTDKADAKAKEASTEKAKK